MLTLVVANLVSTDMSVASERMFKKNKTLSFSFFCFRILKDCSYCLCRGSTSPESCHIPKEFEKIVLLTLYLAVIGSTLNTSRTCTMC